MTQLINPRHIAIALTLAIAAYASWSVTLYSEPTIVSGLATSAQQR